MYLPHSDKSIGYQFILLSRPTWMMEAARRDKNGVLQSVPWSVGRSLSDVTSASRGSPNQPIRRNEQHQRVIPEDSFAGRKLRRFKLLEKYVSTVRPISLKLCEVVSRTGFRTGGSGWLANLFSCLVWHVSVHRSSR